MKQWEKECTAFLRTKPVSKAERLTSVDISISLSLKSSVVADKEPEASELLTMLSYLPDGVLSWKDTMDELAPGFTNVHRTVRAIQEIALVYTDPQGTCKDASKT